MPGRRGGRAPPPQAAAGTWCRAGGPRHLDASEASRAQPSAAIFPAVEAPACTWRSSPSEGREFRPPRRPSAGRTGPRLLERLQVEPGGPLQPAEPFRRTWTEERPTSMAEQDRGEGSAGDRYPQLRGEGRIDRRGRRPTHAPLARSAYGSRPCAGRLASGRSCGLDDQDLDPPSPPAAARLDICAPPGRRQGRRRGAAPIRSHWRRATPRCLEGRRGLGRQSSVATRITTRSRRLLRRATETPTMIAEGLDLEAGSPGRHRRRGAASRRA